VSYDRELNQAFELAGQILGLSVDTFGDVKPSVFTAAFAVASARLGAMVSVSQTSISAKASRASYQKMIMEMFDYEVKKLPEYAK